MKMFSFNNLSNIFYVMLISIEFISVSIVSRLFKLGLVNFFNVHSLNDAIHFINVIHSGTNVNA